MACTTQSACEYVSGARRDLIKGLNNLSVILENLFQQEVFSDEEVSKIQAEKDDFDKRRKILDKVTKKGEAACYEFLRILDRTRQRTLARASPDTGGFDLHHWISCYPFIEDTKVDKYVHGPKQCHSFQKRLISKAQKLYQEFWTPTKNMCSPNLSYSPLVLDTQQGSDSLQKKKTKTKKSKMPRPKKLRTYLPKEEVQISLSELMKINQTILLVGKPGIGKTAVVHEILRLWVERSDAELDYMMYFDMRGEPRFTTAMKLQDLLFSEFSQSDEDRDQVFRDVEKNSENFTMIFDGVTHLHSSSVVQKLVKKDLLPNAKIIITCRPDDEEDIVDDCPEDIFKVEVKGFNEQTIRAYLSEKLGEEHKQVLNNLELLTLCHVPLYALMVVVCFSSETQPCTITELYINIVRFCLLRNNGITIRLLNSFIKKNGEKILALAKAAFDATERKSVIVTALTTEDTCVCSFVKTLYVKVAQTDTEPTSIFLHYTMQEFFAAMWLLKNPCPMKDVLQQCLTEKTHMKHLIPFMCRLLSEKAPRLMEFLIPAKELKEKSKDFFEELSTMLIPGQWIQQSEDEDSGVGEDMLFLCQCLYESQSPETCLLFLDKLDYCLDLSGQSLDPFSCCAVSYVVTQSKEKKVKLDLEGVTVSEEGVRRLQGCLQKVHWSSPLPCQLWKRLLLCVEQMDHNSIRGLNGNKLHLPVNNKSVADCDTLVNIIWRDGNDCLSWNERTSYQSLYKVLSKVLPNISLLSFVTWTSDPSEEARLLGNLLCAAAEGEEQTGEKILQRCLSVCTYQKVPLFQKWVDFQLDLYSYEPQVALKVLPSLQSVLQSAPPFWTIDLSQRKASILLEVLKLQSEKKQVEVTGWTHEESEVRSFLQCLPHISQLRCDIDKNAESFGNLWCAAADRDHQTGEKNLQFLSSVCTYQTFPLGEDYKDGYFYSYQSKFLLDLYCHVKESERTTGLSILPSLQSVLQSVPPFWTIDLSQRKASILLEVLKLQSQKKQVEVTGWTHEESEVRSFLQCLPHISQLGCDFHEKAESFGNLWCAAADRDHQTGEKNLQFLSSVCTYRTFPLPGHYEDVDFYRRQSKFLLDLYCHVKESERTTGLSILPSLQSVLQSAPPFWTIDLSQRKASILLEVLKLQSQKKRVEVTGWTHEESEVRSFLQCLPHISQLGCYIDKNAESFGNLWCAAADRDHQTGEKNLQFLSSVCTYRTFPFDEDYDDGYLYSYQSKFLLDLCCHVKESERTTGLSILPSLQSVLQSVPPFWTIDLSQRKASILLEVLKLQSQKKRVEVTGWTHEESEVRSFLQCLPHISQLGCDFDENVESFGNLWCAAADRDHQTGEKNLQFLSSVCTYQTFPRPAHYEDVHFYRRQSKFLLDLCCHVKESERTTGLSILPSLQSVLQSVPPFWTIDLSQRKASILLEVLKLQSEKKQVEVTGWTHEESEVRSFLQCLPHISQLGCYIDKNAESFGNLWCAAADRDHQTGEKNLQFLSSVCTYRTFPFDEDYDDGYLYSYQSKFLLDLCCHVKESERTTGLSILPSLQSVLQSVPPFWTIDLSQRKASILLEVLKLQSQKKRVEVTGWTHEESEVRSFLQCLPHISQLGCDFHEKAESFGNLWCAAADRDHQTGEKNLQFLSSVCTYRTFPLPGHYEDVDFYRRQSKFLLDLYCHVKESERTTGLSILPSLQSVLQSAPPFWTIDLSQRKASILLEVLKLQSQKKRVEVTGWTHEESEVRSFLQCLPHISQLGCDFHEKAESFGNLWCAAADRDHQTGEKNLQFLSSVCTYRTFPLPGHYEDVDFYRRQSKFLLDLYCHVKESERTTGLSILPSLQSVLQSAPPFWTIDLSQRKASILLEVLKLQSQKKRVEVTGWTHEESEVRSFLQCLPHISQLGCDFDENVESFGNLWCAAADRDHQTGEKNLQFLSSVCTYQTFPFDEDYEDGDLYSYQSKFLLDLYCHVKESERTTGLSILPSLQSVLQSAPTVWTIDLSQRKASILLEVLKLQSQKKQVLVTGWTHEESEVRSFLQCLPHISQLRCDFHEKAESFGNLWCAAADRDHQTGEKNLQFLSSVCTYRTFPLPGHYEDVDFYRRQSKFLLDLYCHVKESERTTGLSILPSLQSVLQSAPPFWTIDLSQRKASILLEVLKLQSQKKRVEVTGWTHEESEVRSFLQCLPHISQLGCYIDKNAESFGNLWCAAADRDHQTGEKNLQFLSSVCTYRTFPFDEDYDDGYLYSYQSEFLLDLCCHVKESERTTGLSILPSLQSVLQSAPTVWTIDLSQRKASILLEVLKLQSQKKRVEVTGWTHEESEVRSFLQCLPHISLLSSYPAFFQRVCSSISITSKEETQQLVSLLQLQGFSLLLEGPLNQKTRCSVGRVLRVCGRTVDLTLTKVSTRVASALFQQTYHLRSLRLSASLVLLLFRWMKRRRMVCAFTVDELHVVLKTNIQSDPALAKVVSGVSRLLRHWTVRCLNLTEFCVPALSLITLVLHDAPLKIKLDQDYYQQWVVLLHEIQDKHLSSSFVNKCGGDLSACCLNWGLLHNLLQQSCHTLTVNMRKNSFLQEKITDLLPFLHSVRFLRPSPSFVIAAIREIHKAHADHIVPGFLRSLDHVLTLTCRELDSADFTALLFTLKHSHTVTVNLLWTSIPTEGIESLLFTLEGVSQLSIDRNLLLRLVRCCASSDVHQRAASELLRSLKWRLDLSCTSCVPLSDGDQSEALNLTTDDCRAISIILRHTSQDTQLDLRDCEVEDSGLDLLLPVPDRVHLSASNAVVLRLLSLGPVGSERDTVRRMESLWKALRGELDLSYTTLDQRTCRALVLMLDLSEGLTELDLSHCQLTDRLLLTFSTLLHKVQVLDLSHNHITDASTDMFLQLLSINTYTQTVRLFKNNIVDTSPFNKDQRFEIW